MSEKVYEVVKEYIASKNHKWRFVFGDRIMTRDEILRLMEEDKTFREFVVNEVIKTAVDLITRRG